MTAVDTAKNLRILMYCLTGVLCVLIVTLGSCTMHENYLAAKAIQHGANPLEVACTLTSNGSPVYCAQVAQAMASKK